MIEDDTLVRVRGVPWPLYVKDIREHGIDVACDNAHKNFNKDNYPLEDLWVCDGKVYNLKSTRRTFDTAVGYISNDALLKDPRIDSSVVYELKYPYMLVNGIEYPWDDFYDPAIGHTRKVPIKLLVEIFGEQVALDYLLDNKGSINLPINIKHPNIEVRYNVSYYIPSGDDI